MISQKNTVKEESIGTKNEQALNIPRNSRWRLCGIVSSPICIGEDPLFNKDNCQFLALVFQRGVRISARSNAFIFNWKI